MMGSKRFGLIFTPVLLMGMVLTACVAPVAVPAQPASETQQRVIHVLSEEISPESQAFYRKAAEDFEKANPGVVVSLDFPTDADALAIRVAAGDPPEISTMQLENQLYYADLGLLEPATWWFDKHGDDVVDLASVPYQGVYYAIPYALTSEMWMPSVGFVVRLAHQSPRCRNIGQIGPAG